MSLSSSSHDLNDSEIIIDIKGTGQGEGIGKEASLLSKTTEKITTRPQNK